MSNREHAVTTLYNLFLSLTNEPICFSSSKTFCVVIFWSETACVSKARDWPGGWQMLGPRAVQHLQMPHPRDWQGGPAVAREGGGGWAQVELTDALSSGGVFFIIIFNESAIRRYIDRGSHHEIRTRWSGWNTTRERKMQCKSSFLPLLDQSLGTQPAEAVEGDKWCRWR